MKNENNIDHQNEDDSKSYHKKQRINLNLLEIDVLNRWCSPRKAISEAGARHLQIRHVLRRYTSIASVYTSASDTTLPCLS